MRHFLLIIVMLVIFVGCSNQPQEQSQKSQQNNIEQTHYQNQDTLTNSEIATHLATIASKVSEVHDAAAIIAGPYAVVGIDIDEHTERERVGTIKYSVTEALQHDPYGRTAVVIADGDIMTRIREMGNELNEGHPVQGISEELANIVSRYMPTVPPADNQNIDKSETERPIEEEFTD